jgi:hypothetical protein
MGCGFQVHGGGVKEYFLLGMGEFKDKVDRFSWT